jgi:hypothetical protein
MKTTRHEWVAPKLLVLIVLAHLPRSSGLRMGRRAAGRFGFGTLLTSFRWPAIADDDDPPSLQRTIQTDLGEILETTRSPQESLLSAEFMPLVQRPSYGIEAEDCFYPDWCLGRWRVTSTLASVQAPAGVDVFSVGRNGSAALEAARREIGQPLVYDCRWLRRADGRVVVDRGYNTASISQASMGPRAVQNTQEDGPNHLVMYLQPSGAPNGGVFRADLQVVSRRTESARLPTSFACAETVRQSVVLVPGERSAAPAGAPSRVKEVEAICTYEAPVTKGSVEVMRGCQRTATFLVPDVAYTANPTVAEQLAIMRTRGPGGRSIAIDMRHYDLVYEKLSVA